MNQSRYTNSPTQLAPGTQVAQRYCIVRHLGAGADGISYLATDLSAPTDAGNETHACPRRGSEVVVKVYRVVGSWTAVRAWEREARALENLDHPAIPKCLEHRQLPSGELLLVRSYCPGQTLQQRMDGGERLSTGQVQRLTEQLLDVLVYMQSLNPPVIHGDIKPSNIVFGDDEQAYLIDFAAVRETLRARSLSGLGAGTVGYAAPEQVSGRANVGSDLYSLGATLVHLLSHVHPSDLPQRGLKLDYAPHIQAEAWFSAWLGRLLEPRPEDRFADACAARAALQRGPLDESSEADSPATTTELGGRPVAVVRVAGGGTALSLTPPAGSCVSVVVRDRALSLTVRGVGFFGRGVRWEFIFFFIWTGYISVFTLGALLHAATGGVLMGLFMIPFWLVAAYIAGRVAFAMWGRTTIDIAPDGIRLLRQIGGWSRRIHEPLLRWSGARILEERRTARTHCSITLGVKEVRFGGRLAAVEQEWIVNLLNAWAQQALAGTPPST
jgi:eukaryotic-like serine/threonine-protein kinase